MLEQVIGLLQQRGRYQADWKVSARCRTGCRWLGLVAAIDGPAASAREAEEGSYPLLGLLASGQILEPDPQARIRVLAFEGQQGDCSFPLAALAAELRDAAGRLDALDSGDPAASVRALFSWSYNQLSTGAARMFRLLGLHSDPGPTPAP